MSDIDLGTIRIRNSLPAGSYNNHGFYQFVAHMEEADRRSTEEAAEEGARVARLLAPKKTGRMASTIRASNSAMDATGGIRGAIFAEITVGTNHWKFAESGTVPHEITGQVSFWWAREQRRWHPGPNIINHPGMLGSHFMQAAYVAAAEELIHAMRRNYAR